MNKPIEFLDLDDVNDVAVALLGDPAPRRDLGLLGSAVARPFLEINGIEVSRASNHDVYDLVIEVSAGRPTIDAIAERLRQLTA